MAENKIISAVKKSAQLESIDADNTRLKDDFGNEFTITNIPTGLESEIPTGKAIDPITTKTESEAGYKRAYLQAPNGLMLYDVWEFDTDVYTTIDLSLLPKGRYHIECINKTQDDPDLFIAPTGYDSRILDIDAIGSDATGRIFIPILNTNNDSVDGFITDIIVYSIRHEAVCHYIREGLDKSIRYDGKKNDLLMENLPGGYTVRLSRQ